MDTGNSKPETDTEPEEGKQPQRPHIGVVTPVAIQIQRRGLEITSEITRSHILWESQLESIRIASSVAPHKGA
jgi:hypothetical protein